MTVYVDELRDYGIRGAWAHMWTDGDDDELHEFARRIGLKRSWQHESRGMVGRFLHYDLGPKQRKLAVNAGAVEMPLKEWIRMKAGAKFEQLKDKQE